MNRQEGQPADESEHLHHLSASAAVAAMRRGELSSERYAAALLDRARDCAHLNAFISLPTEQILESSRDADRARARGDATGCLHGLPIAVKDAVNTKDMPTTIGTRSMRAFQPAQDAALVSVLRSAGALVFGKTNLTELAFGWSNNNLEFGAVRNPYDPSRIPGGSSGGSAAAVAARIVPVAIGGDTLGSIRVPAAMCGVVGLRPTLNRYPNAGAWALAQDRLDQLGGFARTVEDLQLLDYAITSDSAKSAVALGRVRLSVAPFYWEGLDSEVERLTQVALTRLQDVGVTLIRGDIPDAMKSAFPVAATTMLYESVDSIRHYLNNFNPGLSFEDLLAQASANVGELMRSVAMAPNRPPAEVFDAMQAQRGLLLEAMANYFRSYQVDAIVFPTITALPPSLGEEHEVDIGGRKVSFFDAFGRNTALSPASGTPSLTLPVGLTAAGLPVSLEFVGLAGMDRHLLSVGAEVERVIGRIAAPPA